MDQVSVLAAVQVSSVHDLPAEDQEVVVAVRVVRGDGCVALSRAEIHGLTDADLVEEPLQAVSAPLRGDHGQIERAGFGELLVGIVEVVPVVLLFARRGVGDQHGVAGQFTIVREGDVAVVGLERVEGVLARVGRVNVFVGQRFHDGVLQLHHVINVVGRCAADVKNGRLTVAVHEFDIEG